MKVLVTGAGGFLGRNLLAGLETLPLSRRPQVLSCHRDTPPDLPPAGAGRRSLSSIWPV